MVKIIFGNSHVIMDIFTLIKLLCFYVLVASTEMLNGIARTIFLNKRVGTANAKRISTLSALSLCLLICYFYVPLLYIRTDRGLMFLGISLSAFMLVFDLVVGRYVVKARWRTILDDFNICRGNLLAIGLILMAFCPLLSAMISRIP
ncbi:MAG: hypothetical protein ACM3MB_11220 [Acidobacteriota bacterium]